MISIQLLIFLTFTYIVFSNIILYLIFNKKLFVKYSLPWLLFIIVMTFLTFSNNMLTNLSSFLGIEIISNMLFFFGFLLLMFITLITTLHLSNQKTALTILAQEIGILNKKIEELNEKRDK